MRPLAVAAILVLFCLASGAIGADGEDYPFKKPADRKTWGELLADYAGYGGYSKSYALVVGISNYKSYRNLPTENDPIRVKDFLLNEAGFDYVHLLTQEEATRDRIHELMVDEFPRLVDRNDRFLFYWSGHGVTRPVGTGNWGYLPLASTPPDKYSAMISMKDIERWDDLMKAEQTLYLLDSCFSGLAGNAAQSNIRKLTIEQMANPSRHLMTAGTAGQQTIAIDSLGGSIFTRAVLDGLRGEADTTSAFARDGLVSVNELEVYVKKRVAFERDKSGWEKAITPQLRDLAVNEGEFFFLTGDHKSSVLSSRGTKHQATFAYGEPVPMSENFGEPIVIPLEPPKDKPGDSLFYTQYKIQLAQERLQQIGLDPGAVDGILGSRTSSALMRFQRMKGLRITGDLNSDTWTALTSSDELSAAPRRLRNDFGMEFVFIPPGNFMMGSPENEPGRDDNEQQHQVTLTKGFYMQTTEVTQGQWQAVMESNPSGFGDCGADCPVEKVSWNDAQKFIDKLNKKEGANLYRLPTDAEWEYAARAGTETAYYTGNTEADLDRAGWYRANSNKKTHPVAQKAPNEFGLYDLHGNVWEWCQDWYPEDIGSKEATDPKGPTKGSLRVLRGGSWFYRAEDCRAAHRYWSVPVNRLDGIGFRLVRLPGQ